MVRQALNRKINYQIIASIAIIFLLFACKKRDAKWPVYVTVSAKMAHNNTPIAGVKWKIIESSSQGSSGVLNTNDATGWEQEGVTNSAGLAIANFYPKKDLDYHYDIVFDYSSMNVPAGNYEIVKGPSTFAIILRENENIYDIKILPHMDVNYHYQNINCFDSSDEFIRTSYTHEYVTELNSFVISSYSGCFNQTYSNNLVPMRWYF